MDLGLPSPHGEEVYHMWTGILIQEDKEGMWALQDGLGRDRTR